MRGGTGGWAVGDKDAKKQLHKPGQSRSQHNAKSGEPGISPTSIFQHSTKPRSLRLFLCDPFPRARQEPDSSVWDQQSSPGPDPWAFTALLRIVTIGTWRNTILETVGENGVAWYTGLLGKPHISDFWQPLGNIDYHGMIHHHQEVLEKKKYKIPVPVSILVP